MQQISQESQQMLRVISLIEQNPFATLISLNNDAQVCHLPLSYDAKTRTFYGHSAANNPLVRQLVQAKTSQSPNVKIIFNGEHAYVSPTWHQDIRVPTWDYAVVHVNGKLEPISDEEQKQQLMAEQVGLYESHWQLDDVPQGARQGMLKAITVFTISADGFFAKFKMSQQKSEPAKLAIVEQLRHHQKMVAQYQQNW